MSPGIDKFAEKYSQANLTKEIMFVFQNFGETQFYKNRMRVLANVQLPHGIFAIISIFV